MLKSIAAALFAIAMTVPPASADMAQKTSRAAAIPVKSGASQMLPPPGYKGQWWTAPNRCEYSRTGQDGETVWYLIINTAHRKCDAYLVEKGA